MNLSRRLRTLFRRRAVEAEMAEEMRHHLEERAAAFAEDGLGREEAQLAARRAFGNASVIREHARDTFGWGALERLVRDLALALRQLLRSPGFTLLALVSLGLGIGANTSMFSVMNGVLLTPLPYANLDRLERVWRATPQFAEGNVSPADFLDLRQAEADYGEFAGYLVRSASLADPGAPAELVTAAVASPNLFQLLGVQPYLGRAFLAEEGVEGRDRVVILSQRVWQNRYGARADILEHPVRVDGEPHRVVGVLPPSFNDWRFLGAIDVFRPLAFSRELAADRSGAVMRVIGRRAEGVDPGQAAAFLAETGARLARAHPTENGGTSWWSQSLQTAAAGSRGDFTLTLLVALSGFVLLLACANLANLNLVRTLARTREFALRAALGASRLQLLRPLALEALLLSLGGGVLALVVVGAFHRWARIRSTGDNGEQVHFVLDPQVLGWTVGASLLTALAFGIVPALYAGRVDLNGALKSGARGATGGRGTQRFRRLLVIGQFAVAVVLLAGAAVFVRGLDELHDRRGGWEDAGLVTGTVALPLAVYSDDAKITDFQRRAVERLEALPGVETASFALFPPYFHWSEIGRFHIEGHDRPAPGAEPAARVNRVGAGYFAAVGTPLIAGRVFGPRDDAGAGKVYVISQSTARTLFGRENPLGRRLAAATGGAPEWGEIVGVVADVETVEPDANLVTLQIYEALAQKPRGTVELLVRLEDGVSPVAGVPDIRAAIAGLDPDLPVRALRPAQTSIERSLYQLGVLRDMLGAFGVLGLGLASVGVYGVLARTMAQRSAEFSIRLALGAGARDIARLVFGEGIRLALAGSVLGLAGAAGVAHLLTVSYPGIRANSPLVLGATTAFLVGVAVLACWLPARRATRIDAIQALRAE